MVLEMAVDVASTLEICHGITPLQWFGISRQGICGNRVAREKPHFDPPRVPLGSIYTTPIAIKASTI